VYTLWVKFNVADETPQRQVGSTTLY